MSVSLNGGAQAERRIGSAGRRGTAGLAPTGCQPSPRRAARRRAALLCPPIQMGGWGFCSGCGRHRIESKR